jgi:preprotein translocase SecE subunit
MDFTNKITNYIRETMTELGLTTWPTSKDLRKYTMIVIIGSAVVALILGGFDSIYMVIKKFLNF